MRVVSYPAFERVVKKLHANAKQDLDKAVKTISRSPLTGDLKKGDLSGVRVFKFNMVNHVTLLAYTYNESEKTIALLALGSHENFYRSLKRSAAKGRL